MCCTVCRMCTPEQSVPCVQGVLQGPWCRRLEVEDCEWGSCGSHRRYADISNQQTLTRSTCQKYFSLICRENYQSFCPKWQNNFVIILRRRISTVFGTILRWFRFPIICNFRETLEQSIISWCCCIQVVTRVSSPNNLLPASFCSEHWLLLIS